MKQKTWCLEKRSTKETEKKIKNNKSRKRKEHTLIKQEQN